MKMLSTRSILLACGILLHSAITMGEETPANCGMSSTTGCLNGEAYNYLDKKVCGQTVYDRQTVGCCHIATPFEYTTEFCCYGKVNPKSLGTCAMWTAELEAAAPACWDCSGRRLDLADYQSLAEEQAEEEEAVEEAVEEQVLAEEEGALDAPEPSLRRRLATWPSPFPFDTVASGASPTPCTTIDSTYGCFNTYKFFYSTDYICENYLLKNSGYGCCDGIPYRFSSQTCCFLENAYVVKNADHWCACTSIECVPTNSPTLPATPTGVPILRPTSEPSLTFTPTALPTHVPSQTPSLSHRPTSQAVVAASGLEDEPFKVNYLYGAAAFVVLGVGAVWFLQTRASSLIKERHEVALEIADTNFN